MLADAARLPSGSRPNERSQSCSGSGTAATGGWGCSWRCSMRLIELEAQLQQLRGVHAEAQARAASQQQGLESQLCLAAACETQAAEQLWEMGEELEARQGDMAALLMQVEQLGKEGREAKQRYSTQLADKEEEVIGRLAERLGGGWC